MAPSSKPLLILTVLSLAATAFAGAALWLPRRRRRAGPDSGEAPSPPAEGDSPATVGPSVPHSGEAPPPSDSLAIVRPVSSRLRAAPAPRAGLIPSVAPPPASIDGISGRVASIAASPAPHRAAIAGLVASIATPEPLTAISGLVTSISVRADIGAMASVMSSMGGGAHLAAVAGPVSIVRHTVLPALPLFITAGSEEGITIWWDRVLYFFFDPYVSLSGQLLYVCTVLCVSFSPASLTVSVMRFVRSEARRAVILPAEAEESDPSTPTADIASSSVPAPAFSRTASSAGLSPASSADLSPASSAGLSPASSAGLSPASSALSRSSSSATTITQLDEAQRDEDARREEELKRRRLARNKKQCRWWRKIGAKLVKKGVKF